MNHFIGILKGFWHWAWSCSGDTVVHTRINGGTKIYCSHCGKVFYKTLVFVIITAFCSSCIIFKQQPVYEYSYKCIEGDLKDTVFYSRVLYYPGDTIVEIPSRNTIVIKDIKFYTVKRN